MANDFQKVTTYGLIAAKALDAFVIESGWMIESGFRICSIVQLG